MRNCTKSQGLPPNRRATQCQTALATIALGLKARKRTGIAAKGLGSVPDYSIVLGHLCLVQAGHGVEECVHVLALLAGLLLHVQPQHATALVGSPARRVGVGAGQKLVGCLWFGCGKGWEP